MFSAIDPSRATPGDARFAVRRMTLPDVERIFGRPPGEYQRCLQE